MNRSSVSRGSKIENQTKNSLLAFTSLFLSVAFLSLAIGLQSCVTVNVNFPEGAVQQATDDYVKELYRSKQKDQAAPSAPSSFFSFSLISSAQAESSAFNVNTARAKMISDKLKTRVDEVLSFKKQGILGETSDGFLVLKDASSAKPMLKKKISDLVAAENVDRKDLYTDLAAANKAMNADFSKVAKSFANSFQSESPSGTWVQDITSGKWEQKP